MFFAVFLHSTFSFWSVGSNWLKVWYFDLAVFAELKTLKGAKIKRDVYPTGVRITSFQCHMSHGQIKERGYEAHSVHDIQKDLPTELFGRTGPPKNIALKTTESQGTDCWRVHQLRLVVYVYPLCSSKTGFFQNFICSVFFCLLPDFHEPTINNNTGWDGSPPRYSCLWSRLEVTFRKCCFSRNQCTHRWSLCRRNLYRCRGRIIGDLGCRIIPTDGREVSTVVIVSMVIVVVP